MDTIVACATPFGHSGIAVIRLSGQLSLKIITTLCRNEKWTPRYATLRSVYQKDECIDQCLILWMKAPKSFTGEDTVEISCHGNPIIVNQIIELCIINGARLARAGEYSRRAVQNKKLSLIQIESLSSLLTSKSMSGVFLSQKGLSGSLDHAIAEIKNQLLDFAAEIEARLDHPDGDLSYVDDQALGRTLNSMSVQLIDMAEKWEASKFKLYGATIVIVGTVNAGKSSLFNQIIGSNRAIVSEIEGTTRDVVEKTLMISGIEVCLQDTAGIRLHTTDKIEQLGMSAGIEMAKAADICLIVAPLHHAYPPELAIFDSIIENKAHIKIGTFSDALSSTNPQRWAADISISNLTKSGLAELSDKLTLLLRNDVSSTNSPAAVSQRQHDLFIDISRHLQEASSALLGILGPAVAAEEIVQSLDRISELTGEDTREIILDRLFSRFCIGK